MFCVFNDIFWIVEISALQNGSCISPNKIKDSGMWLIKILCWMNVLM